MNESSMLILTILLAKKMLINVAYIGAGLEFSMFEWSYP